MHTKNIRPTFYYIFIIFYSCNVEHADLTEFAEFLKSEKPEFKNSKFIVWGWSYGGFVASHVAGNQAKIWDCAIAIQPITSADSFDTIFIEKLMKDKNQNSDGYEKSVAMSGLDKKQEYFTKFSVIMGTGDNAHHFSNAALMEKKIVNAGFEFNNYFISNGQSVREHYIQHRVMHGVMDEVDKVISKRDFEKSGDLISKRAYSLLFRKINDCVRGEL